MPESHVGASKPDPKTGNKVEPTTYAKPAPEAEVGRHTAAERERDSDD